MKDEGALVADLERLAAHLGALPSHPAGGVAEARRASARRLAGEYLASRLASPKAPLVVAVVGPAGSGKSTLINSIGGRAITSSGVLRPTTTEPVVWTGDVVPGTLDGPLGRLGGKVVDTEVAPPDGIVLVDTPPPGAGDGARQILAVADACVVVTTGLRYADAIAWDLIDTAAARRLPAVYVLNRLPEPHETQRAVVGDFTRRLADRGLLTGPDSGLVVAVADGPAGPHGLPREWATGLRKELEALGEAEQRSRVVRRVTGAALARLQADLDAIRAGLIDDAVTRHELVDPVHLIYRQQAEELAAAVMSGDLADLVGDPEVMAADLAALVTRRAGRAARTVAERWEHHPVGSSLLAASPGLWSHGAAVVADARSRSTEWHRGLQDLVAPAAGRWFRGFRRRSLAATLAAAALDPQRRPGAGAAARLDRVPGALGEARDMLVRAMREVLEIDAGRFLAVVGSSPSTGTLGALTLGDRGDR